MSFVKTVDGRKVLEDTGFGSAPSTSIRLGGEDLRRGGGPLGASRSCAPRARRSASTPLTFRGPPRRAGVQP
ncbi:MAG: hypothetical protein R3F43_29110 [bacterium]